MGFFIILVASHSLWSVDDDDGGGDEDGQWSVLIILLGPLDFNRLNL